jgi:hypothetical protein
MKNFRISILAFIILLFTVFTVDAGGVDAGGVGTRAILEVEVIKGDNVKKSTEIFTFDGTRGRIDFPDAEKKITDQTPYIMTVDGGESWVMGNKAKDRFYCSEMQTEEFFKNLGSQFTDAIEFFNVKAQNPTIKKILEEPGPEILGYKTTHVQLETNAKAYAWFLILKFEYSVKIIHDIWYATDVEIHPIKRKWINAITQSSNDIIDSMFTDFTSNMPGPILKKEAVIDITDARKNETKTKKVHTVVTELKKLTTAELDEIFKMPECEAMDDDEVQEKAKFLFYTGKLAL